MAGYALLDSRDIVAGFFPRYEQAVAAGWGPGCCMNIDSDTETENYKWLGQAPQMREWVGGRHEEILNRFTYSLKNAKYESTLNIPLDDLRRDKTGQLRIRVDGMADKASDHPTKLLATLIDANGDCYDDQSFFDTDHDESGSDQVNELGATQVPASNVTTAANPTADEMADILVQTIGWFYTITDDKGDPMNGAEKEFTVVCTTPQQWGAAAQAVGASNLSSGKTNPIAGLKSDEGIVIRVKLEPRLTTMAAATQFAVLATGGATKPFIYQEEVPLETQLLGVGSDYEFDNDSHKFGVKKVCAVGFGFWQKAMRVTLS